MRTKILFCLLSALLLASAIQAESASDAAGVADSHLAKAIELRADARKAYDTGDYDTATVLAKQAKAELDLVRGKTLLPASYTVRLIPGDRDCLSKIAGYPFVYGDRSQWVRLYQANKATLKHPEDADILLPGEVILIPSLAGEKRSGDWSEGKNYPSASEK